MLPEISIFIPAYNAGSHLENVIKRFPITVLQRVKSLWIINDGSTDNTEAVIKKLKSKYGCIKSITHTRNRGYGKTVRAGLQAVQKDSSEYVFCIHADGQYPPESIPDFIDAAQKKGLDLIQGSRMSPGTALQGGMPLYKYIAGKILTRLENFVFGLKLTDYHSGYLCYGSGALGLPFDQLSRSFDFDLEVIASARNRGLKIGEVGIPTRYAGEDSHLNPITYGLRVLKVLFKYKLGAYAFSRR